jgi:FkbM family methyltransferase
MVVKDVAAKVIEAVSRRDLVGLGNGSVALVDRAHREQAWFAHRVQLERLVQRLAVDLVLDVGAYHGGFAKLVRQFYGGVIVSFEPVSTAFEVLSAAAAADPKWHVVQVALGETEAEMAIHAPAQGDFSSLLPSNAYGATRFGPGSVATKQELVKVRRLDAVLAELDVAAGKRIFLKIDTQGYDTKVFAGLGDRIEDVVAMQSEVSLIPVYEGMPHWTESIQLYERAGFGVVGLYPVTNDGARVIEYDCLMERSAADPASPQPA